MNWKQYTGDVGAATYGATFLGTEEGSQRVTFVEIHEPSPESMGGNINYFVTTLDYGPEDLSDRTKVSCAMASIGMDPYGSDDIDCYYALFAYLGGDPGGSYPTLKAAMDAYEIPAEALWDPREHEAPNPDVPTCGGCGGTEDLDPRDTLCFSCQARWDRHTDGAEEFAERIRLEASDAE
jgi:hypothetical protein